jgi:hypothetical protein
VDAVIPLEEEYSHPVHGSGHQLNQTALETAAKAGARPLVRPQQLRTSTRASTLTRDNHLGHWCTHSFVKSQRAAKAKLGQEVERGFGGARAERRMADNGGVVRVGSPPRVPILSDAAKWQAVGDLRERLERALGGENVADCRIQQVAVRQVEDGVYMYAGRGCGTKSVGVRT